MFKHKVSKNSAKFVDAMLQHRATTANHARDAWISSTTIATLPTTALESKIIPSSFDFSSPSSYTQAQTSESLCGLVFR